MLKSYITHKNSYYTTDIEHQKIDIKDFSQEEAKANYKGLMKSHNAGVSRAYEIFAEAQRLSHCNIAIYGGKKHTKELRLFNFFIENYIDSCVRRKIIGAQDSTKYVELIKEYKFDNFNWDKLKVNNGRYSSSVKHHNEDHPIHRIASALQYNLEVRMCWDILKFLCKSKNRFNLKETDKKFMGYDTTGMVDENLQQNAEAAISYLFRTNKLIIKSDEDDWDIIVPYDWADENQSVFDLSFTYDEMDYRTSMYCVFDSNYDKNGNWEKIFIQVFHYMTHMISKHICINHNSLYSYDSWVKNFKKFQHIHFQVKDKVLETAALLKVNNIINKAMYNPHTHIGKHFFNKRIEWDGLDGCFADE